MIFISTLLSIICFSNTAKIISKESFECVTPEAIYDLNTSLPLSSRPEFIKASGNITNNATADKIPEQHLCQQDADINICVSFPVPNEGAPNSSLLLNEEEEDKHFLFPSSSDCCPRHPLSSYGGEPIRYAEYPSLALLHYMDSNARSGFPCGGTLISKRYIITAAHCVTGKILNIAGKLIKIRLGEHDLTRTICENGKCNNNVHEFEIEKVIIHEEYNDRYKSNDIALIRLAQPVDRFRRNISPMCLQWIHNSQGPEKAIGEKFIVVGWGRTSEGNQSAIGNKVYLPHYDRSECSEKFKKFNVNITNKQICAGGEYNVDACDGDSGGPLISNINNCNYLEGVVSFGKGCGTENWPGVYTNVTAYRQWIIENMEP